MKILFLSITLLIAFTVTACGKKGETGTTTASADTCKELGPSEGRMKCANNTLMFCSSYSNYVWKEQRKCGDKEKCQVAADGKSGTCK